MAKFIKVPFAYSGDKTAIPDATQPSGVISYTQGFGPFYALDQATETDALDIPRQETNQILFDLSSNIRQYQEFGVPDFITTSDNGGTPFTYSLGAKVRYDAGSGADVYVSLIKTNTDLPTVTSSWALDSASTPDATETVKGKAELATQAETNTGTDDTRIITPLKLKGGLAYSFATSGYIKFPSWAGGFIIQWGQNAVTNDVQTPVTLPLTFPNAGFVGFTTMTGSTGTGPATSVISLTTTTITIQCSTSKTLNWFCVGY